METLYFLLPICAVVALVTFAIVRINTRSYLHRRVEARIQAAASKVERTGPINARERIEHRYVDWFTDDRTTRVRDRAMSGNIEKQVVGQAVMASGMAYQPSEAAPVASF